MALTPLANVTQLTDTDPGPPGYAYPNAELVEKDMAAPIWANDLLVVKVGDTITPHGPTRDPVCPFPEKNKIISGSLTVIANDRPVAVGGESIMLCAHMLIPITVEGIPQTVFVGGTMGVI